MASVNYRLSGEAKFPAAEQDVKAAIRWLRTNAEKYRIDKTRFAVWGSSAGGGPGGFLGCQGDCSPEVVRLASPASFADLKDPPMLLIHGAEDKTVSVKQSQDWYDLLKKNGVKAGLIVIPGAAHSFVGQNIDATGDATLKALDATLAFFDATIGGK